MKTFFPVLFCLLSFAGYSQSYSVGDRVDAYATDGKYYAATIQEVSGNQYKLRYIGFGAESDAWTKEENLVRGAAKGDKIVVAKSSEVYYGTVEDVASNNYKIKYDGYAEIYTLTRNQFNMVSSIAETRANHAKNNNTTISPTTATNAKPATTTTTTTTTVARTANGTYPPGTKLLGLEGTTWYAATVLNFTDGKYKVKWDNYSTEALLTPDQVKLKPTLPADKAQPVNGRLYLRSLRSVLSGYHDLEWFFLGDNGIIVLNPQFGTSPVNPALEQADNYGKVGTYTIGKTTLDVNWLNGHKTKYPLEMSNGEIELLDGGVMVRQKGLPDNFKLNGTYDGSMAFGTIRAASTYTFTNDGGVTLSTISTVGVGGAAQSTKEGKYSIKGNTLTITFNDGTKTISNIGMLEGNSKNLVVNGRWLTKK